MVFAQRDLGGRATDSGGVLIPEQAAYDVISNDLDFRPNIEVQNIKGILTVKAKILQPIDKSFDCRMPVEIKVGNELKRVEMPDRKTTIEMPESAQYIIDPNGWLLNAL